MLYATKPKNLCLFCQTETHNPKFCSRSCSAKYNNKKQPKRTKTKQCGCGTFIYSNRLYCKECFIQRDWTNQTLKNIQGLQKYQVNAYVRQLARKIYKNSNKPKCCVNCGYSKHYEVCHIKAINSYDENSLVSEINNIDNLIALCPNCHWELDNNHLKLSIT